MKDLFGQVVFSVGPVEYRWEDLVTGAVLWGDWDRLRDRVREGLACLERFEDEEDAFEEERTAAACKFREARDLIAAEEMEAWLQQWGLTVEAWTEYIAASFLRRRWSARLPGLVSDCEPANDEVDAGIKAEGICSGEFERWAHKLAARAAVDDRLQHETLAEVDGDQDVIALLQEFASRAATDGLPEIPVEAAQPAIARVARLESSYRRFCRRVLTPEALDAQVRSCHADWTRLDCQIIAFRDAEAAREAALCVREDGRRLDEVAAETNQATRQEPIYIENIEPDFRDQFLSAQKGELVGPLARGDEFVLYLVLDKVRPSRQDARVAARAEEAVLQRLSNQYINDRVKWHCRF